MKTELPGRAIKAMAAALLGSCIALCAHANGYPSRPVTLVVPFTPGGSNDALARTVGQKLGEYWKQPVIVDNRPGAGGNVGTKQAAKAAPDGHTLLVVANNFVTNPFLYPDGRAGYDPVKEFVPVTQLGRVPFVLGRPPRPRRQVDPGADRPGQGPARQAVLWVRRITDCP